MSELRVVMENKEFRRRVEEKLMQNDKSIKKDDLYFSQTMSGYYLEYKPAYPNRSDIDFIVSQNLAGNITVCGNDFSYVPRFRTYENIGEFERKFKYQYRCLESILTGAFGCSKPFLAKPVVEYTEKDGMVCHRYLTQSGIKAYSTLVDVIYGLETIGVLNDANEIVERLDEIVSGKEY